MALGMFAAREARQAAAVLWAGLNGSLALLSHPIRRTMVTTDLPGLYHATLELLLKGLTCADDAPLASDDVERAASERVRKGDDGMKEVVITNPVRTANRQLRRRVQDRARLRPGQDRHAARHRRRRHRPRPLGRGHLRQHRHAVGGGQHRPRVGASTPASPSMCRPTPCSATAPRACRPSQRLSTPSRPATASSTWSAAPRT